MISHMGSMVEEGQIAHFPIDGICGGRRTSSMAAVPTTVSSTSVAGLSHKGGKPSNGRWRILTPLRNCPWFSVRR
jgi:hypothetical protein